MINPEIFQAPTWARGPHQQTILARMLRPAPPIRSVRERIETPDDDFVDIDWSTLNVSDAPIVIVLHGLEGSSHSKYVRNVCRELNALGVRTLAMNFRGCSGEPNRALPYYHSGDTRDLILITGMLRERHPRASIGAMGFSLGGNVLLKAMGESIDGGQALFDAAAVMSVPYDLAASSALLQSTRMGRIYSEYFMRSLRRKVLWKQNQLAQVLDMGAIARVRSIEDLDEAVTAPLNGFNSAGDYYTQCSSTTFLAEVRVPTLMLHSEDDPFLPSDAIPHREAERNPALRLLLTPSGGHVGFIGGTPWAPEFWGEIVAARFLAHRLKSCHRE
ncbi:MAG TPA: hypothetical protein DG084_05945 [Gemmatimonadetes bacterium]|jgi:predicted alpha/beta-fold hydrolase|nr:hypothetical protein [Gemmatimonadota bacterium]